MRAGHKRQVRKATKVFEERRLLKVFAKKKKIFQFICVKNCTRV